MHVDYGYGKKPLDFQRRHFQNARLAATGGHIWFLGFRTLTFSKWFSGGHIGLLVSGPCRWHNFRSITRVCFGSSCACHLWLWAIAYWFSLMSLPEWPPCGGTEFFGFWTLNLVWFRIPSTNLTAYYWCVWVEVYWILAMSLWKWPSGSHIGFFWFPDSNLSLALNINSKLQQHNTCVLCTWVESCPFAAMSFSKWPPGGHMGFFLLFLDSVGGMFSGA